MLLTLICDMLLFFCRRSTFLLHSVDAFVVAFVVVLLVVEINESSIFPTRKSSISFFRLFVCFTCFVFTLNIESDVRQLTSEGDGRMVSMLA